MKNSTTYALLTFIGIIWGFQPTTLKWLLPYWSPSTITIMRYLVVGVVILLYQAYIFRDDLSRLMPARQDWPWIIFMGINGQMLNSVLQFYGLQFTTVTNSTLITATTPALTSVCTFIILREKFTSKQWLGIFLSFLGVLTVITKGDLSMLTGLNFNKGDVFCIASQFAWAFYSLASRKLTGHMDVLTALGWCSLSGTLATFILSLYTGTFAITPLPTLPLFSYLYVTLLGGIAANVFWNIGVKNVGPSVSSVFLNLTPVVGMLSGWLIFNDPMGFLQLMGAGVIFIGVFLTTHG
jgi:drug/metabolite transporter (DMT)-like permease